MGTSINIHDAKTQLSRLLVRVEQGEEIVIARAGRAVARLVPVESSKGARELGFLAGRGFHVPADFNEMGRAEIAALFGSDSARSAGAKEWKKSKRPR